MICSPCPSRPFRAAVLLALVGPLLLSCRPADPLPEIRARQQRGDFWGSIEPLQALLAQRPDDAELHFLHGRALAQTQQPSLAEWSLRKAMEAPEWRVRAGLLLAQGALAIRNFDTALEITGRVLEVEPDNLEALVMRANARAHSRRNLEETLVDVERIEALDPEALGAMEPKILALLGLARIDEAAAAIAELGERLEASEAGSELRGWHCATRALFAEESGELDEAAERFTACLELHPTHPNVVRSAIAFHDGRRELARSREILERALEEQPDSRDFRVQLAARLRLSGEGDAASAVLREGTQVQDARAASIALMDLSAHYHAAGDLEASAEASREALALAQSLGTPHPKFLLLVADTLLLVGDFERALEIADQIESAPHRELVRARVAHERGDPALALEHYDAAVRLWPNHLMARYFSARAAEEIGDFPRAIESYRYAIRIDPDETDARVRLARLYLGQGQPAEALTALRTQAGRQPLDVEGHLLSLRLWAQLGRIAALRGTLEGLQRGAPALLGRALASAAEGARARGGAAAAVRLLRAATGVDLSDPLHADALRALVRFEAEAGRPRAAEPEVEAALSAHPDLAAFHEIRGLWLELGEDPEAARAAYERALELDAGGARALLGLGRLALGSDPTRALAFFERAHEADADDPEALRGAARALRVGGRGAEAEQRLRVLLLAHPTDAAAAAELAELRHARGAGDDETVALARRAVRFGGGASALEVLSRVHELRGESEPASRAAARARAIRERRAPAPDEAGEGAPGEELPG